MKILKFFAADNMHRSKFATIMWLYLFMLIILILLDVPNQLTVNLATFVALFIFVCAFSRGLNTGLAWWGVLGLGLLVDLSGYNPAITTIVFGWFVFAPENAVRTIMEYKTW